MKVVLSLLFLFTGLALCWIGVTHFASTVHGIGATELMRAEVLINAPVKDSKAIEESLAALRRRLRQADDETIRFSLIAAGFGVLFLCVGAAVPISGMLTRMRKEKMPNQTLQPTPAARRG